MPLLYVDIAVGHDTSSMLSALVGETVLMFMTQKDTGGHVQQTIFVRSTCKGALQGQHRAIAFHVETL